MLQYKNGRFSAVIVFYKPNELIALLTWLVTELDSPLKIAVKLAATMPNTMITRMMPSNCPLISDIASSFLTVKSHDGHPLNGNGHFLLRNN